MQTVSPPVGVEIIAFYASFGLIPTYQPIIQKMLEAQPVAKDLRCWVAQDKNLPPSVRVA